MLSVFSFFFFFLFRLLFAGTDIALVGYNYRHKCLSDDSIPIGLTVPMHDVHCRDPYIFVDRITKTYYIHVNQCPYLGCWQSKNLQDWTYVGHSFSPDSNFWGKEECWAPDTFLHNGRYYIFATFISKTRLRGTSALIADNVKGPYHPLKNEAITPLDWYCLDGTIFIDDDNKPWFLYSHDLCQVYDGQMIAQRIDDNLMYLIGEPHLMFHATNAPWVGKYAPQPTLGYVTDSPIAYRSRSKKGELLLTWSSYDKNGKYCIGLAKSDNGKITGKWTHFAQPLNTDDGGHCMMFEDLEGIWRISYHSPNHDSRLTIHRIADENGVIRILPD